MTKISKLIDSSRALICSEAFKRTSRKSEQSFTRDRKMNFQKIMCFCLNFAKKSLQLELDNYIELLDEELEQPISKQAFSKARQNISPEAFRSLFLMTCETLFRDKMRRKYKGYGILAIDGTEVELSRSKELATFYPPARTNTTAPRGRASSMCDTLNGHIIHADLESLRVDERTLAIRHLEYYKSITNTKKSKDIFILDRGYPSKNLIEYFEKNEFKYLMRIQKSFNFQIDHTNKSDFYINLNNGKSELKVRVIKLTLLSGEQEILITNLGRRAFNQAEFQHLYSLRWGIETKYDTLKNKLLLEDFSGKTVVTVQQDFYATLYLANIASAIKVETDEIIARDSASKNLKRIYLTNEALLIGKLKDNLVLILMCDDPHKRDMLLGKLIDRISSFKVAVIHGRHFSRPTEAHKKTRSRRKRVL